MNFIAVGILSQLHQLQEVGVDIALVLSQVVLGLRSLCSHCFFVRVCLSPVVLCYQFLTTSLLLRETVSCVHLVTSSQLLCPPGGAGTGCRWCAILPVIHLVHVIISHTEYAPKWQVSKYTARVRMPFLLVEGSIR